MILLSVVFQSCIPIKSPHTKQKVVAPQRAAAFLRADILCVFSYDLPPLNSSSVSSLGTAAARLRRPTMLNCFCGSSNSRIADGIRRGKRGRGGVRCFNLLRHESASIFLSLLLLNTINSNNNGHGPFYVLYIYDPRKKVSFFQRKKAGIAPWIPTHSVYSYTTL